MPTSSDWVLKRREDHQGGAELDGERHGSHQGADAAAHIWKETFGSLWRGQGVDAASSRSDRLVVTHPGMLSIFTPRCSLVR